LCTFFKERSVAYVLRKAEDTIIDREVTPGESIHINAAAVDNLD